MQAASTNSMKGMVSKGKFQEIQFLNPPPAKQQAFGRFAEALTSSGENFQLALAESQALFQSLQGAHFARNCEIPYAPKPN